MIERQVPGVKFDIDRTEAEVNVIHNEIPNHQKENWCKAGNFTYFYNK